MLRGSDPAQANRIVLVTGHYDSRNSDTFNGTDPAPGANDDGSGTAVSLECARVLSKFKFPATIIFLTVAGEEQGLNGSNHFAQMAKQQGWKIEAVLNNDIVGGDRSPRAGCERGASVFRRHAQRRDRRGNSADSRARRRERFAFARTGALYRRCRAHLRSGSKAAAHLPSRPFPARWRSSFLQPAGIRSRPLHEFREDYNHQHQNVRTENGIEYGDLPKFVNFDYVAHVARLNAATLASIASAPASPANVKMLTKNLENDTTLTWEASPGATAYEVVWRATSAPDWEHVQTVTSGTRATLKVSKDNVIFGVRALDAAGHRSLPVVPEPER